MASMKITIETPKGSRQKYDFDVEEQTYLLKKILPIGMSFPYDFGFIPGTKGGDGDPLDVIVISDYTNFPGCVANVRIIGAIRATQSDNGKTVQNDRFVAVLECDELYIDAINITDIPQAVLTQLEAFFIQYNKLEGRKFKVDKILSASKAAKLISQGTENKS